MKIIAIIPNPTYGPEYVIQIGYCEIAALMGMMDSGITAKRNGKEYSISSDKLQPGDEISSGTLIKYSTRVSKSNEAYDEIKKAISCTRGALTKLENVVSFGSEAEL